jgi:hypothetical protein
MARTLTPSEVRRILTELVHALADRGEAATVHVIGGAAVALSNPQRTSTTPVMAVVWGSRAEHPGPRASRSGLPAVRGRGPRS